MCNQAGTSDIETMTLAAMDGYPLAATCFHAAGDVKGYIVLAGATGVPQGFYRRFALRASQRGFSTLTFDYRGIGGSKPERLRGFEASFLDWARLDVAAAIETVADKGRPVFMMGHSFGGQTLGMLPNHHRLAGLYTFGTGAGWYGWMTICEGLRVRLVWNVALPLLVQWKGYAPMSLLGVGEDLPLGVYRQWRHWCSFPKYLFGAPDSQEIAAGYADVKTPIVAANALDDLWALPASRNAFMRGYVNAPVQMIDVDPRLLGNSIGHMGYFRQSGQALWDEALDWFEKGPQNATASSAAGKNGNED
jgi:predicted alpha/beta hydrolase